MPWRLIPVKFLAFYLGCLGCHLLQTKAGTSPVAASAAVGLAATFVPVRRGLQAAVYAGTFAGMCSHEIIAGHRHILIISLIGAVLYVLFKERFNGIGGKLGAIAFVSSLLLILVRSVS